MRETYFRESCSEEYIGETGNSLQHQITVHRQQIRQTNVRILYVSSHIANCARNYAVKFKLFPLYTLKQDSVTVRKMQETYFIEMSLLNCWQYFSNVERHLKSQQIWSDIKNLVYVMQCSNSFIQIESRQCNRSEKMRETYFIELFKLKLNRTI